MQRLRSTFVLVSIGLFLTSAVFGQGGRPPRPESSPTPPATAGIPTATPSPGATPAGDSTRTTVVQPSVSPSAAPSPPDPFGPQVFGGFRFRSIGPAVTSGRVIAFAVDPTDRAKYYAVSYTHLDVYKRQDQGPTRSSG